MSRLFLAIALAAGLPAAAAPIDIAGPSGLVRAQIDASAQGPILCSVHSQDRVRLHPAPAGLLLDGMDIGTNVVLGAPRFSALSEVFPWRGHKSSATNRCRIAEIPVRSLSAGLDWTLEVRVFDDGAAFRYRVPGTGSRRIRGESTAWQLPHDATVWFQTDTQAYEGEYRSCLASQIPIDLEVRGARRPVHLGPPVTVAYAGGGYGLITEARLRRYSGLTLRPEGGAMLRAAFEDDPAGWPQDGLILSPWRVIILSEDLNGLVNSDIIAALNDPPDPKLFPEGMQTDWICPGKAPCTWMVFGNDGAQWDRQKWFVDQSAALGCEYLLVDAGWRSERWGWLKDRGDLWQRAAELCRYAAQRNVGIVLWHAFPEGRDDGPGLTDPQAREDLFRRCREAGVKGVKIDFFNSESKAVIDACEDLLERAARHRLLVNFHGAHKPTGEPRTWPHEITREGIREQEYLLWSSLPLAHYGALPFTRMAAGHADFLPGYLQPRFLKNTTRIFQMAAVIVFSSPFLCWPDHPDAYLHSPLLHFARTVPVTWDETRVLPGSAIGDTVALARRKGPEWYLAALNCRPEPRTLELGLDPLRLSGMEIAVYRDGPDPASFQIDSGAQLPPGGLLRIPMLAGGGFILHARPAPEFAGWK